jgi:type II secretory pathway pseudopilin PulG
MGADAMKSAFTLTEILVSLSLSSTIACGLLGLLRLGFQEHRQGKCQLQRQGNLAMTIQNLADQSALLDPSFWQVFPPVTDPVHGLDWDILGPRLAYQDCVVDGGTCFSFWDVEPAGPAGTWSIASHAFPDWIDLVPLPGSDDVPDLSEPGWLALIYSEDSSFCLLIAEAFAGRLHFCAREAQPWNVPELEDLLGYEVNILGRVSAHHFSLVPTPDHGEALARQTFQAGANGWQSGRRSSGFTNFREIELIGSEGPLGVKLKALPCGEEDSSVYLPF